MPGVLALLQAALEFQSFLAGAADLLFAFLQLRSFLFRLRHRVCLQAQFVREFIRLDDCPRKRLLQRCPRNQLFPGAAAFPFREHQLPAVVAVRSGPAQRLFGRQFPLPLQSRQLSCDRFDSLLALRHFLLLVRKLAFDRLHLLMIAADGGESWDRQPGRRLQVRRSASQLAMLTLRFPGQASYFGFARGQRPVGIRGLGGHRQRIANPLQVGFGQRLQLQLQVAGLLLECLNLPGVIALFLQPSAECLGGLLAGQLRRRANPAVSQRGKIARELKALHAGPDVRFQSGQPNPVIGQRLLLPFVHA